MAFDAESFLKNVSSRPGVYQMMDDKHQVLYVGKAKQLDKRLASYFRPSGLSLKTQSLVSKIADISVTVTSTEAEALILEQNLIKSARPPYNILLRDDKSYPYIFVSEGKFPRISFHRGARRQKGKYFGPFPNSSAVRETLSLLQKLFRMRQCEDSVFRNRSRACLQHQIGRCDGPCVQLVSERQYQNSVEHTMLFLEGRSDYLLELLQRQMSEAAEQLDYEQAAELRDCIRHLQQIYSPQQVEAGVADLDVVAAALNAGQACVQVMFVRQGRVLGSRAFYPKLSLEQTGQEVLSAFIAQYYLGGAVEKCPPQLVVGLDDEQQELLQQAINQKHQRKVQFSTRPRGIRAKWLEMANRTAAENLQTRLVGSEQLEKRYSALSSDLGFEESIEWMECFDISHHSGEATVASCVVFDVNGPNKNQYRRFNIKDIKQADDYKAIEQAVSRRYNRRIQEQARMPDVVFIDGGKGQLGVAARVFEELGHSDFCLLAVAKGPSRKPGMEQIFRYDFASSSINEIKLSRSALHLVQHIRDEAHRFAVAGHHQSQKKQRGASALEQIPGVGAQRRKALLQHFGGRQGIEQAGVDALARVPGISQKLAQSIYDHFH